MGLISRVSSRTYRCHFTKKYDPKFLLVSNKNKMKIKTRYFLILCLSASLLVYFKRKRVNYNESNSDQVPLYNDYNYFFDEQSIFEQLLELQEPLEGLLNHGTLADYGSFYIFGKP